MKTFRIPALLLVFTLVMGCGKKDADEAAKDAGQTSAGDHKDIVELNEESRKNAHIESAAVVRTNVDIPLNVPGRIGYDLNRTSKVSAPVQGRILRMNYDVGAPVKQGDVVAVINSPDWLNPLELKAPLDGTVAERQGAVGDMIDAAKEIYTISYLGHVWCIASISEQDGAAVHVDQPAVVRVLAYPNETFTGRATQAGQVVDEATRTLEARVEVDNRDGKLKPGMFATVSLSTGRLENQLLIPDDAVQTVSGQTCVFVEERPGKYRVAAVQLGETVGGQHIVQGGLNEGARVVISGSFVLKSELLKASMEEP